mmetsp:Transcript_6838/g.15335  ORF Transcript_6838/g.15335 Transcript_6838/m.15335 type:complete len:209 (-) Transcript_6838:13-639(-)
MVGSHLLGRGRLRGLLPRRCRLPQPLHDLGPHVGGLECLCRARRLVPGPQLPPPRSPMRCRRQFLGAWRPCATGGAAPLLGTISRRHREQLASSAAHFLARRLVRCGGPPGYGGPSRDQGLGRLRRPGASSGCLLGHLHAPCGEQLGAEPRHRRRHRGMAAEIFAACTRGRRRSFPRVGSAVIWPCCGQQHGMPSCFLLVFLGLDMAA